MSHNNYNYSTWRDFYISLKFLFETERELFETLSFSQQERAADELLTALDITEEILDDHVKLPGSELEDKFKNYDLKGSMNFIK